MLGMLAKTSRSTKRGIALSYDLIFICLSLYFSAALRLSTFSLDIRFIDYFALSATPLLAVCVFWKLGLYNTVIRYATFRAFATIIFGLFIASVALIGASFFFYTFVPRSVPIIFLFISIVVISLPRLLIRNYVQIFKPSTRIPVLIFGAGENGINLAYNLLKDRTYFPAAFIDNNTSITGNTYNGIPVFLEKDIPALLEHRRIRRVFIATENESKQERLAIVRSLEKYPIRVQAIPAMHDIIAGKATINQIHDIDIADLLGRDPVEPHYKLMRENIDGKNVLVTGAGGSIGSELCRQILNLSPQSLILYDSSEFNLYKVYEELCNIENAKQKEILKQITIVPILGNIQNESVFGEVLSRNSIQTIYHSAAYKHVHIVESNPFESIKNNLFGTICCVQQAIEKKVETFVLISTDKAVRPTSIMGASKRLSEMVLQALTCNEHSTTLCMVRFGNVLNSSGSVVPKFREQIKRGGPITVTHPDITRYFMTTTEAAQLVIQAGALAKGGEIFVLEMGEPVRIADLAKEMIQLSGLTVKGEETPDGDIEILYIGVRPGEKLFEELIIGDNWKLTSHPRILQAEEFSMAWDELTVLLATLQNFCEKKDFKSLQSILMKCSIAYSPTHPNSLIEKRPSTEKEEFKLKAVK